MKLIKQLLALVAAVALTAFAPTGMAASTTSNGSYTLTMQVAQPPTYGTAPTQVTATILNTSPKNSNTTFNSVDLFVDLSGWNILGATATATGSSVVFQGDTTTNLGHVLFSKLNPVKPTGSLVITLSVDGASCGDGNWDVIVYPGSNLSGNPFLKGSTDNPAAHVSPISCAKVACNNQFTAPITTDCTFNSNRVACTSGIHGAFNSDGTSTCNAVDIFVTNALIDISKLHFRWPVGVNEPNSQPLAAFAYKVTAEAVLDVNNVPQPPTWQVAWLPKPPAAPVFIVAPKCAVPGQEQPAQSWASVVPPSDLPLPAPYGVLITKVKTAAAGSTDKISVQTSASVPALPFNTVIDLETMHVTAINGNTWTVTRGYGTATNSHVAGATVMSTPLQPLLFDYTGAPYSLGSPYNQPQSPALQGQVCLASAPVANGDGTWSVWVIDEGDSWIAPK